MFLMCMCQHGFERPIQGPGISCEHLDLRSKNCVNIPGGGSGKAGWPPTLTLTAWHRALTSQCVARVATRSAPQSLRIAGQVLPAKNTSWP